MNKTVRVERTSFGVRLCHWLMVICFGFVALSGLSWFFPYLSWFNNVLFTPQLARILHPFLGILVFVCLAYMFIRLAKYNIVNKADKEWLQYKKQGMSDHENPAKVGKYNMGQKVLFWLIMLAITALLITGLVIWRAYFAEYFPIPVIRLGLLLHSLIGFALMCLILGHIYLAYHVKGTLDSMTKGSVSKAWAKTHHSGWYEEQMVLKGKSGEK